MALDQLITARAAALFASDLPYQGHPGEAAVEAAIGSALTAWGGVDGCVGALAAAHGDHPETLPLKVQGPVHGGADGTAGTKRGKQPGRARRRQHAKAEAALPYTQAM